MQAYFDRLNAMMFNTLLWNSFLSLYLSMQVAQKTQIFDEYGMTGISSLWTSTNNYCWNVGGSRIMTCSLDQNIGKDCIIVSNRYYVNTTEELFVEIKTLTRNRTTFVVFATFGSNKLNKTKIDNIAKIPHNITFHEIGFFFKATDTFSFVKYQGYDYLTVGFDGISYCGEVASFSMYYYICPESIKLVEFVREPAPMKSSSPKMLVGKCTNFAMETSSPLTMRCYFNGSFEVLGSCECRPGFTNVKMKCQGW